MINCFRPAFVLMMYVCGWSCLQAEEGPQVSVQQVTDEVNKWRAEHEAQFASPSGWLALTGHYWLKPGDNSFGTGDDCVVRLPADAANDLVGNFRLSDGKVQLTVSKGGPLLADGKELTQVDLPIDAAVPESNCPTKLQIGERLNVQLVRRAGRYAVRVRDSSSESIRSFKGKHWFDVSADYRLSATYAPLAQPKSIKITNIKGDEVDSQISGTISFVWQGQSLQLDAIQEDKSLFVIFKDKTSGNSTYGAGRFVDVDCPADGSDKVVIDFNKAYFPPCARSPHTLCPLPPKQNHLPIAIEAGERN